jgi:hypothetical protein
VVAAVLLCGLGVACGGDGPSEGPSATVAAGPTAPTTSVTPTTTEPLREDPPSGATEQEVEAAYLRSWDVYADAMLRLDPSRLGEVYAGDALDLRRDEVAGLARDGTPGRMRVDHDYEVVVLNATDALVLETYVNHSVLLDGTTMQPIEPDPNTTLRREYVLTKEPDGWRVSQVNAGS